MNIISYDVYAELDSRFHIGSFKSYDSALNALFDTFEDLINKLPDESFNFRIELYRSWTNGVISSHSLKRRISRNNGQIFHFHCVS